MFRPSIQRKIVSIALGLIILMVITSVLSIFLAAKVSHLLDELTNRYIPAYSHLARANIRSLERGLTLRRMVIAKMEDPPDEEGYESRLKTFEELSGEIEREAIAARELILAIIADPSTPSDNASLGRLEYQIETVSDDLRGRMNREVPALLSHLNKREFDQVRLILERIDSLRDEFTTKIDTIRSDMLKQVYASAATVIRDQHSAIVISGIVTALAAAIGLAFAIVVSGGITRPVRQLLQGARDIEAGHLDKSVVVTGRDEIAQLAQAFNNMVDQLRQNARVRETFGRYIDPQIAKGLLDQSSVATEGQRRTMTVMFCDMKGFTAMSEGMTPRGLVQVMNRYFSTMSEPIRVQRGIIDKYIGDAIMAYWGPPFIDTADEGPLACQAALDMLGRVAPLRAELPEMLGVKSLQIDCDLRIGIAAGDVLVGSIGSELMMSYTVMGDAVNLASRLEHANNTYGTRILVSEAVAASAGSEFEFREVDRLLVAGQSRPLSAFDLFGRKGELTSTQARLRTLYAAGLEAYRVRRWSEAREAFNEALRAVPGDGPSLTLLNRLERIELDPPDENWDGSWSVSK
jgi:class 3 adenylate cyclase